MTASTLIELFGYLGSTMVVVSMLMSSVVKLRVINTIGSVISGTYALIIGSFPLALMNICLVVINLYNLRKLLVTKQEYDLVTCSGQDAFVHYFVSRYLADIQLYFPGFRQVSGDLDAIYMVFCNGDPAGILLAKNAGDSTLEARIEYTTPTYRDCSIGKFLYDALPGEGVKTLIVEEAARDHAPYLEKMGYVFDGEKYVKTL